MDGNGDPFVIAALADGIGGMKFGAESASLALGALIESVVDESQQSAIVADWLKLGALRANQEVHRLYAGEAGSTLVAVLIHKHKQPMWLSIGDSRIYQSFDRKLRQLSKDDTLEGQLGKPVDGSLKSDLLQYIGVGDGLEPHVESIHPEPSSIFFLTSDGVHFVGADILERVVLHAADPGVCVRRLVDLAKILGGPDNASVAAVGADAASGAIEANLDACFEVWDAFGDLHVLLDRRRRPAHVGSSHAEHAPVAPVREQGQILPKLVAESIEGMVQPRPKEAVKGATGEKKQRSKGGRRSRGKSGKPEETGAIENEAPQLRIEFPNKQT